MEIDFSQLTAHQRYKLMSSLIVPRPIALVKQWQLRHEPTAVPVPPVQTAQ